MREGAMPAALILVRQVDGVRTEYHEFSVWAEPDYQTRYWDIMLASGPPGMGARMLARPGFLDGELWSLLCELGAGQAIVETFKEFCDAGTVMTGGRVVLSWGKPLVALPVGRP